MQYAIVGTEKTEATPKARAICPCCNTTVIAKCGYINIWHWSHESDKDCDRFYEEETYWHRMWKDAFPKQDVEVTINKNGVIHRADIQIPRNEMVIELQNSSISSVEILDRELFYDNMIWVINAAAFFINIDLREKKGNPGKKFYTFRWKNPRKSLWYCTKPVYLDFGDGTMLELKKVHHSIPCGGWGYVITREEFLKHHIHTNFRIYHTGPSDGWEYLRK